MTTMLVTHEGNEQTPPDRDHRIDLRVPLVRRCCGPHGPVSTGEFHLPSDGAGLIAVGIVNFRDEPSMEAACNPWEPPRSWSASTLTPPSYHSAALQSRSERQPLFPDRAHANCSAPIARQPFEAELLPVDMRFPTEASGLGRRLALAAAQRGDQTVATARTVRTIETWRSRSGAG